MVLSLHCGLEAMVAFAMRQPHTSSYAIQNLTKMNAEIKQFLAVASMCSWAADSVLRLLLEDDRLPLVYPDVEAELQSE